MVTQEQRDQRELVQLRRWHIGQFLSLGFGYRDSELLEVARVDWRDADDLLRRGCSHETAMLILI
jgi:hypothetical protein